MKILIVIDHYPISPRCKKIAESYKKVLNADVKIVAWNRKNICKNDNDEIFLINSNIGYGNALKKLNGLVFFRSKLMKIIDEYNPDIVHSIDFEMRLVVNTIKNKFKNIYEIYDVKFLNNKYLNYILRNIDNYIFKRSDMIIYASPYFSSQYPKLSLEEVVINNKPNKTDININKRDKDNKITISFIGTIRYYEILKNLIDVCKNNDNVQVMLSGDGPDLNKIKEYIIKNDIRNVILTGRYNIKDIDKLYLKSDLIWSAYPMDENVKIAISNKFFESILYRKPIIVSNFTMLGEEVEKKNIGFSLNPHDKNDIENLIKLITENKNEINNKIKSISNINENLFWEDEEIKLEKIKNIF